MKINCENCNAVISAHQSAVDCGFETTIKNGISSFTQRDVQKGSEEVTRDRQAPGYLQHKKIKSQSKFFDRFVSGIKGTDTLNAEKVVLDLGCGPGPTVKILANHGFENITAIDFSEKSLLLNQQDNSHSKHIKWIQADLRHLAFEPAAADVLIMEDFIQHVGTHQDKIALIKNALGALKPGGHFYLSFFNFNILNYFKGDLHGTFSNGSIPYERLIPSEILAVVLEQVTATRIYPMNITHKYEIDNFMAHVPFSKYIARMYAFEGIKTK